MLPAVRAVAETRTGAASVVLVAARSWYSSPSIISCSRMRLASALMSSNPWPANCASHDSDSVSAEEAVRDVEQGFRLTAGLRQVERPVRRAEGAAALDQLGNADVHHALAAGLAAGDPGEQPLDTGRALACWPGQLVAEAVLLPLASGERARRFRAPPAVCHPAGSDCLMSCRRDRVMPRGRARCRTRTYSLYAPPGIGSDRDSPGFGGVPRAVRLSPADRSAGPPS